MIRSTPSLSEYLRAYCLRRELAAASVEQLAIAIRLLERYAGRPLAVTDLSDDLVNGFLQSLLEAGRSSHTRRTKRAAILCVWRAAADDGHCEPPLKIRKIRHVERVIRAYRVEDLQSLLAASRLLPGAFAATGIPRALWWESFLRTYWDTALRLSDLLRIEPGWIGSDGSLEIVQHKTGKWHRAQLAPASVDSIRQILAAGRPRSVVWPLWARREEFYKAFRRLRERAGLPPQSSSKWIRRGSASAVEAVAPGAAWRHLGHARPGLDRQAYLDRSICDPPPRLPPPID